MMIGKIKNAITKGKEVHILDVTWDGIDVCLTEVKAAIQKNRYRIELNSHRQDNRDLFFTYVIVVSLHEQKYPITYYFK